MPSGIGLNGPDETFFATSQSVHAEADAITARQDRPNLFPNIAPSTLLRALHHPYFTPHPLTLDAEAAAAPLIDTLLSGSELIPDGLEDLKVAMDDHQEPDGYIGFAGALPDPSMRAGAGSDKLEPGRPYERRNVWDEEKMDLSRLKLADEFG